MYSSEGPEQEYTPFIPRRIAFSNQGSDLNRAHTLTAYGVLLEIEVHGLTELENRLDAPIGDGSSSSNPLAGIVSDRHNTNPEYDIIMASHLLR